ncbi:MAG: winged helix-turn-helix domain-containing protein [Fuerstiella sp.]|nr:winged helix-turn-helix domain-containing protein [Fuerstiella sp.]MCP4857354.1 winged helix-turn-helix domain-containing protein [Fuerstiella sp.]
MTFACDKALITTRSVDRFINTLRKKIEPNPKRATFIKTIRNIGYRFESNSQTSCSAQLNRRNPCPASPMHSPPNSSSAPHRLHSRGHEDIRLHLFPPPKSQCHVSPGLAWMDWTRKGVWSLLFSNVMIRQVGCASRFPLSGMP